MKICNFHADTPCRLIRRNLPFDHPSLQAGAYAHRPFDSSFEVYAFFSEKALDDSSAWDTFCARYRQFQKAVSASSLPCPRYILAVEDARLLDGSIERLSTLADLGIRILTPVWGGESIIGGAHDTELGLTKFGREVAIECFRLGIVLDVSHASDRLADEIFEMASTYQRPIIASHSNFRALKAIKRNQSDRSYLKIASLGGVSGISMCPDHLGDGKVGLDEVVMQIEHGLSLDPTALVFGTDFDGIALPPHQIDDTSALPLIAERLIAKGYPEKAVDAVFFSNGIAFLSRAFPDLDLVL